MASYGYRSKDRVACEWIDDWVQHSYKVREPYEPVVEENWENYRVEPYASATTTGGDPYAYGDKYSGAMALKTPESHQIVNALRATLLASLFGVRDYIQAIPVGDEDVESAALVSKLIMNGLEQRGNFRTQWDTLGDAIICGTGVYFAGWRAVTKSVPRRLPILGGDGQPILDPETGRPLTVLQNVDVLVEDDVALRPRSFWDIFHDPAADRFEEARGIVERFRITSDDLESLMQAPTYDAEGIAQVLMDGPDGGRKDRGPSGRDDPRLLTERLTEDDVAEFEKYGVYGGWRFHGMLDSGTAEELGLDPRASATIATINGKVIQAAQSPQKNGELPFGTITILPTGRGLYGLSPLTVTKYLQDVADTQLILTVQAMIEAVYQNYIIGSGLGSQTNLSKALESRKPRQNFMVEGEVDQLVPLPKDYTGMQIAFQSLAMLSQTMRDASNARDPVQGIVGQGNVTATQTQITATSALSNVDQLAVLIERDELPRQARLVNDLYYINLDDDGKVFRRVGDSEMTQVSFFDIDSVADIRCVGARNAMNKVGKSTQFRDFMQLVLSTPIGAASIDWNMFIRKYEDEVLDVKGLDQVLINDPEEILARLQAMGLATSGPPQARNGGSKNEAGAERPAAQSEGTAAA